MSFVKRIVVNDGSNRTFEDNTVGELEFDTKPEVGSFNAITSDAVARAVAGASGEVPQVTENDNGKVLTAVYDAGGPAVEWGAGATADQSFDPSSTNAQSGVAVEEAISGINAPPFPSVSDEGKVLSVAVYGDTAAMEWAEPQGGTEYVPGSSASVSLSDDNQVVTNSVDVTSIVVGANVKSAVVQWKVNSTTTLPTVTSGGSPLGASVNNPASLTVGHIVQVSILNGTWVCAEFTDPANPLDLPSHTIRCKFNAGYTPTEGDTQTLVDAGDNIWDIYKSSNDWLDLFSSCSDLLEVVGANTTGVTRMSAMFSECTGLTSVPLFDTGSVTDMSNMFRGCTYYLTSVPLFDTSSVTDMNSMFSECTGLTSVPLFDTGSVTDMSYMFSGCTGLTSVPLFDTGSATGMHGMFESCTSLTSVPLFDTSSATDMGGMFAGCANLTSVPLFDTSSVTDMSSMFSNCTGLTAVPLFDTSNVTDMHEMFFGCSSLTSVPLFDMSSATRVDRMFYECVSLTSVPLFNTSSAGVMSEMFYNCTSLTAVPLFDTSSATYMDGMFFGCTNVQSGALALYQQANGQANPPTEYTDCFWHCGSNTTTGAAELAQIPASWGGTGA